MAVLGELSVNLIAKTSKFVTTMKKAVMSVTNFSKVTDQAKEAWDAFGISLTTGAAVAGAIAFTRNQLEQIKQLQKTSEQLGISTQALQAYNYAAKLSGIETDNLADILKDMNEKIGLAMYGETGAIEAFNKLGLTADDIARAANPLERIQEALNKLPDVRQRLAAVRELFSDTGTEALNLFKNNLSDVRKEFEMLGGSISDRDQKRLQEVSQALVRVSERFQAIGRGILVDVSPAALEFANSFETGALLLSRLINSFSSIGGFLTRRLESGVGMFANEGGRAILSNPQARARLGERIDQTVFGGLLDDPFTKAFIFNRQLF